MANLSTSQAIIRGGNIMNVCLTCVDAIAYSYTRFGQGSGAFQMRNVGCSGSESRLIDCSYNNASTYCDYYVAGVSCQIGKLVSMYYVYVW